MVRVVRAGQQADRRLTWVGRPGVELLNLDEHLRYERESLGRYPRNSDGAIEWGAVTGGLVLCSMDSDSVELSTVIHQFSPDARSLILYSQGIERTLFFQSVGNRVVIHCQSRTDWLPSPEFEILEQS